MCIINNKERLELAKVATKTHSTEKVFRFLAEKEYQ